MNEPFSGIIRRLADDLDALDDKVRDGLLYVFMDEQEKVLDSDWFDGHVAAVNHARTLDAPLVNVLLYIGCAENADEDFSLARDTDA